MYQIGKTSLWRPPDLQLALNWQQKQRPTREWAQRYNEAFERVVVFLDTSRIYYESELKNQELLQSRTLRRTRSTAIILGIAAIIAILFFILAYLQKVEADIATLAAEQQKAVALQEKELADIARKDAEDQKQLVEQRNRELDQKQLELEKALADAQVARDQAYRSYQNALAQEQLAKKAGELEKESRILADGKTVEAQKNLEIANRLYMLTIAQAMAGKSVQEDDDKDLAGALAMQSYHFHRRYDGKRYDPYIYNALYHALTVNAGSSYNAVRVPGVARNRMTSVAVSRNKNIYYAAGADGRIFSGDYEARTSLVTPYQNPYPNKVIALSSDEHYLVNGTDSAAIQVYDLTNPSAKPLLITNLTSGTNAIAVLPDNTHALISKADQSLYKVNLKTGQTELLVKLAYELKSIDIRADGRQLAGVSWSGHLVLMNLDTREVNVLVENPAAQFLSVKYSPDGSMLAYGTYEKNDQRGLVKLYSLTQRKDIRQYAGHRAGVYDVAFSPDGKLLASAGSDRRMQMWVLDVPEDLPIQMDNNKGFIWDIEFSRDSKYLIAACHDSEIRVWPTDPELLAQNICPLMKRNMTPDEWSKYVGSDIPFETTCVNLLISDY
jgi:hypothetical protein